MKICFKCNTEKPLDEFYKHNGMSDGHLNKCKICTRKDTKIRYTELELNPKWLEKEKERQREKYHRLNYKEKHKPDYDSKKKMITNYRNLYPEKYKAKNKSQKINCPKGYHRHHWSYREEDANDIIILPIKDHFLLHRFIKYDQSEMKYRDLRGTLLSKEDHVNLLQVLRA